MVYLRSCAFTFAHKFGLHLNGFGTAHALTRIYILSLPSASWPHFSLIFSIFQIRRYPEHDIKNLRQINLRCPYTFQCIFSCIKFKNPVLVTLQIELNYNIRNFPYYPLLILFIASSLFTAVLRTCFIFI